MGLVLRFNTFNEKYYLFARTGARHYNCLAVTTTWVPSCCHVRAKGARCTVEGTAGCAHMGGVVGPDTTRTPSSNRLIVVALAQAPPSTAVLQPNFF